MLSFRPLACVHPRQPLAVTTAAFHTHTWKGCNVLSCTALWLQNCRYGFTGHDMVARTVFYCFWYSMHLTVVACLNRCRQAMTSGLSLGLCLHRQASEVLWHCCNCQWLEFCCLMCPLGYVQPAGARLLLHVAPASQGLTGNRKARKRPGCILRLMAGAAPTCTSQAIVHARDCRRRSSCLSWHCPLLLLCSLSGQQQTPLNYCLQGDLHDGCVSQLLL